MSTPARILCLNSGSSSLKFALYELGDDETCRGVGAIENLGAGGERGRLWVRSASETTLIDEQRAFADTGSAIGAVLSVLKRLEWPVPSSVGHRLVSGGTEHVLPQVVDRALVDTLHTLIPFAPLHLPAELAAIEAAMSHLSAVPHVACFDTAFHRSMPERARRLALPRDLWDAGVRRLGFHGLSYEYIVTTLGADARGRCVIAHLGHGASMAAVNDGAPVDTTMGLTPTGGFMMSSRSGDLDPGVVLYLAREKRLDVDALERLLTRQSGLVGVSGSSGDMQELLALRETDPRAALAVDMFCYQIRKQIGAFAAALGGLDTLVFTGGIGERAAMIRREICLGLEHLGIRIDPDANDRHDAVISAAGGGGTVRVIETNENLMVARHAHALTRDHA